METIIWRRNEEGDLLRIVEKSAADRSENGYKDLLRWSGDRLIVGQPLVKYLPSVHPYFGGKSVELRTHGGPNHFAKMPGVVGGGFNVVTPLGQPMEMIAEGLGVETGAGFRNYKPESGLYQKIQELGEGADTVISYACNSGDCQTALGPEFYEKMVPSAKRVIMTPPGYLGAPTAGLSTSLTNLYNFIPGYEATFAPPHLYEKEGDEWVDKGVQEGAIERLWDTAKGKALMLGGGIVGTGALGFGLWQLLKGGDKDEGDESLSKESSAALYKVAFYPVHELQKDAYVNTPISDARKRVAPPTDAQKEAENYRKGHVRVFGFDITLENPAGSFRSGVSEDGRSWSCKMENDYGYIKRSEGADGEHIDVFLGPHYDSRKVWVVNQAFDGQFDEHKVMLGFTTEEEAEEAYLSSYEDGWDGLDSIVGCTLDRFTRWVQEGDTSKPFK